MQVAYPLSLGERQESRVQLLLKGLEAHRRLDDHTGHRDGSGRIVHTLAVRVDPRIAGPEHAVVPVLSRARIYSDLLGGLTAGDPRARSFLNSSRPGCPGCPVVIAGLAGQGERSVQVQPQLTGNGRRAPHDSHRSRNRCLNAESSLLPPTVLATPTS